MKFGQYLTIPSFIVFLNSFILHGSGREQPFSGGSQIFTYNYSLIIAQNVLFLNRKKRSAALDGTSWVIWIKARCVCG